MSGRVQAEGRSRAREPLDAQETMARVRELLGPEGGALAGGAAEAAPASEEEVSALLRIAKERGWRILPRGAGIGVGLGPSWGHAAHTRAGESAFGAGAARNGSADDGEGAIPDLLVSTRRMAALGDHSPADLTVQGGAGLTLGALQAGVAGAGQWLALDPPGGEGVTLGGIVATGMSGPLRILYGRPRDQLLGLTLVDGAGRVLRLGGRVVKNVAGFDLVRLATGSRGGLGVITEVTFRLYPRPEGERTLVWSRETAREAWDLGRALAALSLPFAAAEVLGGSWPEPLKDSGYRVLIRLQGSAAAVSRMRDQLVDKAGLPLREFEREESEGAARILSALEGEGEVAFRAHALPSHASGVLDAFGGAPVERLAVHLLHGTARGSLAKESGVNVLRAVAAAVQGASGSLRVVRAPSGTAGVAEGVREVEVGVSPSTGVQRLHRGIVRGFDPGGILPGSWQEGWG